MSGNTPALKDIKSVLQKNFDEEIEIVKFDTKLLTTPGENYGSIMLAVDANIKIGETDPENMHFVAKLRPANEMLCKVFNIQETFKKELNMYVEVIPALENFEKENSIKDGNISEMFAKCFGGRINLKPGSDEVDQDAMMLFENLKITGYGVGDRFSGFDLEQSKLILENLARFHGVPIAMRILKPDVFAEKVLPTLKHVQLGESDEDNINIIVSEILEYLIPIEQFKICISKIEKSIRGFFHAEYKLLKLREPFCTIVHNDAWVNNIMILNNEAGKPVHVKIVDLQIPIYNSFAYDLLFFFYSSIAPKVLEEDFDNLLKLYYNSFTKCLKEFNVDLTPFSWDDFLTEIATVAPVVLGQIIFMLKPILIERGKIKDMSEINEEFFQQNKLTNPHYANRIINTVQFFMKQKWI